MDTPFRILSLQSFYGGSHKAFIDGWIQNSSHDWEQLTLPARNWKWRMRHAALEFAGQLNRAHRDGAQFDAIVTTGMLDVAQFRGLLDQPIRSIPIVVYFHENQVAYPNRFVDQRDLHFAFTNLTTCLAADSVWFNSKFNRESLIQGLSEIARHWPDFQPMKQIESVSNRSSVLFPGIDVPRRWPGQPPKSEEPLQILWAARWEHDKNPAGLLDILIKLESLVGEDEYQLHILGERFSDAPPEFAQIHKRFAGRIRSWGFVEDREEYWRILNQSDVILSTALHEFFGLAVCEGLAAGLTGILPNRVAYPEIAAHFSSTERSQIWLYRSDSQAASTIAKAICCREQLRVDRKNRQDNPFQIQLDWGGRAERLDQALEIVIAGAKNGGRRGHAVNTR